LCGLWWGLEAMSAGLPVIAAAVPGNAALILHCESGLLVAPGNRVELVEAVVRLAGEGGLRARLGEAGRRVMLQMQRIGRGITQRR